MEKLIKHIELLTKSNKTFVFKQDEKSTVGYNVTSIKLVISKLIKLVIGNWKSRPPLTFDEDQAT